MTDLLYEILGNCNPKFTHEEFLVLVNNHVYAHTDRRLMLESTNALLDRLKICCLREVGYSEMQLTVELFFILLYLHLSESYQAYWLTHNHAAYWRPLHDLIRAISVALDALFCRNNLMTNVKRNGNWDQVEFLHGICEFVSRMRETYCLGGICFFEDQPHHPVDFEELLDIHDAANKTETERPFREFFGKKAGLAEPMSFLFPDEEKVYAWDISPRVLLHAQWKLTARSVENDSRPNEWDEEEVKRQLASGEGIVVLCGRPIFADIRQEFVDVGCYDLVFGRGRFALLVKCLRTAKRRKN
jgi:hypothetical protein